MKIRFFNFECIFENLKYNIFYRYLILDIHIEGKKPFDQ